MQNKRGVLAYARIFRRATCGGRGGACSSRFREGFVLDFCPTLRILSFCYVVQKSSVTVQITVYAFLLERGIRIQRRFARSAPLLRVNNARAWQADEGHSDVAQTLGYVDYCECQKSSHKLNASQSCLVIV